ncbi:phosphate/phosphite/phosphonate ABC transporter substrate-binding protein [Pedobacter frigoris]|uniref:Phosphate/phosphite/phosphonate ABC transporter substrate-binding protein n=1 Tax=Pedobacter frigoris TaxID=2571272 RepID=A0A4U1CJ75_9SPHI|nr:phosphate/phosphite/phosphonate ABC transporter substrate-binding protein [Pedobacter frigoris]TKC07473.1 phosphate/phosphite/phosphonate ABC transporter substrate-binding protein [Pedobacter frigoris]
MKKILICLLILYTTISQAKKRNDVAFIKPIVIATYQYADNNRLVNIQPLASLLEKETGYKVTAKSYPTIFEFISAIKNGEVDIALINTFGYMLLQESGNNMLTSVALEVRADAKDNYKTAIVVPSTSKISSFDDIKQDTENFNLKLVTEGSTSGNLVPRLLFTKLSIGDAEKHFKSVSYGKTHKLTIEAVANGLADLAAMGSAEYFSFIANNENKDKVRLLQLSPEIPLGPVLLNKMLPLHFRNKINLVLLGLHDKNPNELEFVKAGWTEARQAEKYVKINPSYYDAFKKALGKKKDLLKIIKQFAN